MDLLSELAAVASISFVFGWTLRPRLSHFLIRTKNQTLPDEIKLTIIVASDLKMSKGKIASQCSHATLACYKQSLIVSPNVVNEWERTGQPKVILAADSGTQLKEIAKKAANAGLVTALIRDAGRTQVPSGTLTAVGIGPACARRINAVTSRLKLL